jgi:hypothetical protein
MTGVFRTTARKPAMPGHRAYSGPAAARSTSNPALVEQVRTERARRALYAGCERAPVGWEGR